MAADGAKIVKTCDALWRQMGNHTSRWEAMAPYMAPSRRGITSQMGEGQKLTDGVYDSTSIMAAELCAHFIAGHIINPSTRWFNLRLGASEEMDEVQEWLDECRDRLLKSLAASAFYAEGAESLIDWVGFGTGCLLGEERAQPVNHTVRGFRGFTWSSNKTGKFAIAEGTDGRVDTVYRKYMMTARQIQDMWGAKEDVNIPESVKKVLSESSDEQYSRQFTIIHGIYPRPKAEQSSYRASGMPWASCWAEQDSKTLIYESGYRTPPAVFRYQRAGDEIYGRGRGDIAFPDTWTLNSAKRMALEDHAMKIRPPILHAHDSVFGTLRLVPAGPIPVNTHGKSIKDAFMPFETGSRPEVTQIVQEDLRQSIRQIFYVDHILALLQVEKSEMTAYEFSKKIDILFRLIGPVYGRSEWELLDQVVDIGFTTMFYAGAFSPPPQALQQTDGVITVEFENPISRAQRAGDADALMMSMSDLAPFAQFAPQVFDIFDPDKVASGITAVRGVPAKWKRNDQEVASVRDARAEQQATDVGLDRAEQAAGAAGKAAPMLKVLQGGQNGQAA